MKVVDEVSSQSDWLNPRLLGAFFYRELSSPLHASDLGAMALDAVGASGGMQMALCLCLSMYWLALSLLQA